MSDTVNEMMRANVVILHPGSLYLRIGKGSDPAPAKILHAIARHDIIILLYCTVMWNPAGDDVLAGSCMRTRCWCSGCSWTGTPGRCWSPPGGRPGL